jgi:hypothetical protein
MNEDWKEWCAHVQNIEAQYMSNEGILDEGFEIVIHVVDDIDASSENDCTVIGGEAGSVEMSGLCLIPGIAPLSMDNDEDTELT